MMRHLWQSACRAFLAGVWTSLLLLGTSGCVLAGVAAQALPPPQIDAAYKGMQNQSIAVMVWTDIGLRADFPMIQVDVARSLQKKLQTSGAREFEGATWPVDPRSIVRYQRDNPQLENYSVVEIAPKFKVSRLIYLEVTSFQTRSASTLELYRGGMTGTLRVIEIENDKAKIAYEEPDITVIFPRGAPEEGIPNASDERIYIGTLDAFTTAVGKRFVKHESEER
jgi:hypothetical protein